MLQPTRNPHWDSEQLIEQMWVYKQFNYRRAKTLPERNTFTRNFTRKKYHGNIHNLIYDSLCTDIRMGFSQSCWTGDPHILNKASYVICHDRITILYDLWWNTIDTWYHSSIHLLHCHSTSLTGMISKASMTSYWWDPVKSLLSMAKWLWRRSLKWLIERFKILFLS